MPYRFDEWESLADYNVCNNCERFWNNQCDGEPSKVPNQKCPSEAFTGSLCDFTPTRKVTIPLEIKTLQNGCNRLKTAIVILAVVEVVTLLVTLL